MNIPNVTKYIPNVVTRTAARQVLVAQKNSPTILFGVGVAGFVGTVALACRATLKLDQVLEDSEKGLAQASSITNVRERRNEEALVKIKCGVDILKLYAPVVVVGSISVASLTSSHRILSKRNAALTAAYAAVDKMFKEYRQRVVEDLGVDKDREYRYGTEQHEVTTKKGKTKTVATVASSTPSGYARFFDEYSTSWSKVPEYNLMFLRLKQNYANDMLQARGHLFLNEVYDELGIDRSKAGACVGWVVGSGGDNFVDFGVFDPDNHKARDFVNGREASILLDFNVDGVILDKI